MKNGMWHGCMMTLAAFVCVQHLCISSVETHPTTIRPTTVPCSRLLLKGIDDDDLPWLQLAGIYHLQRNFTVDFFPVYKHESIDMYFYYNRSMRELRFGTPYQNTSTLVGAYTNGRTDSIEVNHKKTLNPFYKIITGWYQYDPVSQQRIAISGGKQRIEPTCITDDVVTCSSGMVEFNEDLKQLSRDTKVATNVNLLGLDYYRQIPGFYFDNRPVYTRIRGDVDTRTYLFYNEGRWQIGGIHRSALAEVIAVSSAMRPEHVLGKWEFYSNGRFISVEAKLSCRALTVDKACDASPANQCLNGGTCLTSPDGVKKYCGCAPGYRGLYCGEQIPYCPRPSELTGVSKTIRASRQYFVTTLYEGSVLKNFRSLGSRPRYRLSTCDGSTWSTINTNNLQPTVTSTRTSATQTTLKSILQQRKRRQTGFTTPTYIFEWNDYTGSQVIWVTLAFMQVVNPAIIYFVLRCISMVRWYIIKRKEHSEFQKLHKNYRKSLDIFKENHPLSEEEYDVVAASQFSEILTEYQKVLGDWTRRKKVKRKVKFYRIFSIYANFKFWIFLLYVILYSTTYIFSGSVSYNLFIISAILCVVSYLSVLIEYKWSSERKFIGDLSSILFADERIETILSTEPSLFLRADGYHHKTTILNVHYRDDFGISHSIPTTQKRNVVTKSVLEEVSFQYWRDTSPPPEQFGMNDKAITKVKMTLSIEAVDEETRTELDNQYRAFQEENRTLDEFVDFNIRKRVKGFEKRWAAYTGNQKKPIWVSSTFSMVATFLGLSWPYRWAFNSITCEKKFSVRKLFYIRRSVD